MHRLVSLVTFVALAACSHSQPRGPAWPEPSTTAEDGGESIEPHPSATYAAAVESSSDDRDDVKRAAEASEDKPATAASDDKPVATPASAPAPSDDVFMSEEIIIEIED